MYSQNISCFSRALSLFLTLILFLLFPLIQKIITRTAKFIAIQGGQAEVMMKMKQSNNEKFSFLHPTDNFHKFYRHKVNDFKEKKRTNQLLPDAPPTSVVSSTSTSTNQNNPASSTPSTTLVLKNEDDNVDLSEELSDERKHLLFF